MKSVKKLVVCFALGFYLIGCCTILISCTTRTVLVETRSVTGVTTVRDLDAKTVEELNKAIKKGIPFTTTLRGVNGRDFDATKVKEIKNGITTANTLVDLLGQPYSKTVKSEDEVTWLYTWATSMVTSIHYDPTKKVNPKTKIVGHKKNLTILLKADVVVNFVYDEGPFEKETPGTE